MKRLTALYILLSSLVLSLFFCLSFNDIHASSAVAAEPQGPEDNAKILAQLGSKGRTQRPPLPDWAAQKHGGRTADAATPPVTEVKPAESAVPESGQAATQDQAPEPSAEEGIKAEPQQALPSVRSKPQKRTAAGGALSFFFDDADIYEVIQTIFGDVLRSNYIIDPKVKGRVNFRTITPIPKEEVLTIMEIIFRLNGVGFVEEKGLYRIVPLTDVPLELVRSQTGKSPSDVAIEMFTFKNLNIKDAIADIEGAIGLSLTEGKARVLPIYRLNSLLVIAASKSELDYVRKWVEVFDTMFENARQKIYVYPLQNAKAPHVASMLQSIFGGGGAGGQKSAAPTTTPTPTAAARPATGAAAQPGAPPQPTAPKTGPSATITGSGSLISEDTKIFADEIANSLIILATPNDYSLIEETIKKIDIVPRQVVIEAYLVRADLDNNLNFGFAWSLVTDINISGLKPFTQPINLSGTMAQQPPKLENSLSDKGFTFVATDPTGIVRAKLVAALTDSKAKILASPHVLVSDNREARIQVGQQIPLATSQTATPIGTGSVTTPVTNTTTSTIQYKDIGIILKVKPQINDSGLVSLDLSQEVSSLGTPVIVGGVENPAINKVEATTTLVAQDGETIIIGGLIREDSTASMTGIPILSQIPLIGNLFSSRGNEVTRNELIMVLIPHVIKSQKEARDITMDYVEKFNRTAQDTRIDKFIKEQSGLEKSSKGAGNGQVQQGPPQQ